MGQVVADQNDGSTITRLTIPAGLDGRYRIAQQDDYSRLPRREFLHRPPVSLSLQARVSNNLLPGTWGFGFWNDPFAMGIAVKGSGLRLPTLPQTVWFFYGSTRNDLSFQSNTPANGFTASVFSSASIPTILLPLVLPGMLFLPIKPAARLIRRLASHFIHDVLQPVEIDPVEWHSYCIDWLPRSVQFKVDDETIFTSSFSPKPPLGLVIWIDNQFAAFSADGSIHFGTEANPEAAWLEIKNLVLD